MKKTLLLISLLFMASSLFAQTVWNEVWNMQQMPFQPENVGSEMSIVKAGFDTDGDGWGEFICGYSDTDSNHVMMYEATGDNTYGLVWYWHYSTAANTFPGIAVGDIDNNGKVDIVIGIPMQITGDAPNPPRIFIFEWNGVQGENKYGREQGDGTFKPTNETHFDIPDNTDWRPYSLTIEDVDKDGVNELVVGVRMGGRGREVLVASVAGGDLSGFGYWVTEYNFAQSEGGSNYCTVTGDLDNDGNTDIFEMVWNMFTLRIFENTGPDTYENVNNFEQLYSTEGIDYGALDGLRVVDINGDGKNEMFIAGTEPNNTLFIAQNINDVSAMTADDIVEFYHIPRKIRANGNPTDGKFRAMYVADPDQDGKLSLMIAGERNGQIYDLEYKGEGDLADSTSWELTIAYDQYEAAAVDLGADSASTLTPRFFYGSPAVDMDGDGLSEYVFVNYSTDKDVWPNDAYVRVIEADKASAVESTDNLIPETMELTQNYPNPFNPTTVIEFAVPKNSGHVTLSIYDILGREIATLVDNELNAGNYKVQFDASNLPSGIYMYRLSSNIGSKTMKMILQK